MCSPQASWTSGMRIMNTLGYLAVLPPEIRLIVYQHSMPREHCPAQTRPNWNPHSWDKPSLQPEMRFSLAILRAIRQIYQEISHMLYNRSLKIEIDPPNTRWVTKYLTANAWHFRHVDFARFRRVEIEISTPDRRDPGQLLLTRWISSSMLGAMKFLMLGLRDVNLSPIKHYSLHLHLKIVPNIWGRSTL